MKYTQPIAVILGVLNCIACNSYRHPCTQQTFTEVPPPPQQFVRAPQTTATTLEASDGQADTKRLDALGLSRRQVYFLKLQERYIATESRTNRGENFGALASKLDEFQPPLRAIEVLELLGDPDFFYIAPLGSELLYVYTDSRKEKHLITMQFNDTHILRQLLWGGTNSYAVPWKWSLFVGPEPVTARADAGYIGIITVVAPDNTHLIVKTVIPGSPAALGGIMDGDVLLTVDGKPIPKDPREFVELISDMKAESPVAIVLRRSKAQGVADMTVRVTLGRREDK